MKRLVIAALVAAQVASTATPALAAELGDQAGATGQRQGAFAGARVRIPLGGGARAKKVKAGLTLAPLRQSRTLDGAVRTGFGQGFELGLGEAGRPALTFAGQRVDRLALAPNGKAPEGQRAGVSTLGWIGIGVGAVALVLVALVLVCDTDDDCPPSE